MRKTLLPLTIALAFAAWVPAQVGLCPSGDDRLNTGSCCDIVTPNLPSFPAFDSTAIWFCIERCDPALKAEAKLSVDAPRFVACDRAQMGARFTVSFSGGVVVNWSGTLEAKYSRTFLQYSTTGRQYQVWRFIVNGDFTPLVSSFANNDCQVPPCFRQFRQVHFVGNVDYACKSRGGFDVAASLQHLPGCIHHDTVLSQRPDNGPLSHQAHSYYLVAPQNFTIGANQGTEPQGVVIGEEMRVSNLPRDVCFSEMPLRNTNLRSVFKSCPCVGNAGPMPWVSQDTQLIGVCGSQASIWTPQNLNGNPGGLNLQVVGHWNVAANTYPESQTLIHYQAFATSSDPVPCNPSVEPRQVLYGVGTKGNRTIGFNSKQFTDNAFDLVNCVGPLGGSFLWGVPSEAELQFGVFVQ